MLGRKTRAFVSSLVIFSSLFARAQEATTTTLSAPRVQTAARKSNTVQIVGAVAAAGAAVYAGVNAAKACAAKSPTCGWWIAGTAAAAAVGAGMITAANKSKATEMAVSTSYTPAPYTGPIETVSQLDAAVQTNPDLANNSTMRQLVPALRKLESEGNKIDLKKGTIQTSEGKLFSASAYQNPQSMSNAGLSQKNIEDFQNVSKQMKEAGDKAVAAMGADGVSDTGVSVSGGSGGGAGGGEVNAGFANPHIASEAGVGIDRNPAQVAGMTKNYEGEPIGVSGDSLFDMMNRRYKLHQNKGSFIP